MTRLKQTKLESQARACDESLQYVLTASLVEGAPADRVLAAFFKRNRQFGSRDRRLMRDTLFAVFRWWGWGRLLLPENKRMINPPGMRILSINKEAEIPELHLNERETAAIALFSLALENDDLPSLTQVWSERCNVSPAAIKKAIAGANSLELRGNQLLNLLTPGPETESNSPVTLDMLLPEWALQMVSLPVSIDHAVKWFQKRPPLWLRIQYENPEKLAAELKRHNITLHFHKRLKQAANAGAPQTSLYSLPAFNRGAFEIQDIASQCAGLVCEAQPGQRWWDACAGAGGKSLELAAMMQGKGTIVATDIRTYKLKDLKKRARRPGVPNITCRPWNGKRLRRSQANFDGVLVDAPCSCTGTWRRNPDARWSMSPADVEELAPLQQRLLNNAASGVKPDGVLVYATCSMLARENRHNVDVFLKKNTEFELQSFTNPLTGETTEGTMQIWPWDADCDAMFIAKFRRRS